jgi:hypothetical protein
MQHIFFLRLLSLISITILLFSPYKGYSLSDSVNHHEELSWNNHDAIILSDDQVFDFTGKRMDFIRYSVTRHLILKIQTQEGARKYSEFILPEKCDPLDIIHSPEKRNPGYYLDKMIVKSFAVKITDSTGKVRECNVTSRANPVIATDFYDNRYVTYYPVTYSLEKLVPGDSVDIRYEFSVPFRENYSRLISFRFFFHDSIPKKNMTVRMNISKDIFTSSVFENGGKPDSVASNKDFTSYIWRKSNLAGCIGEPGSRPYLSLPFALFTITPSDVMYRLPYSFDIEFIPAYILPVFAREDAHYDLVRSIDQKVNNAQFQNFWEFQTKTLKDVTPDLTGYNQLQYLTNKVADDFEFLEDVKYFKREDNEDSKLGSYILAQQLRDIKRYDTFIALISSLKLGYFTAYTVDKRCGVMSKDYVAPMFYSDYLLAPALSDGRLQFIYPKSARYGLSLDELPFYFEYVTVRLFNLNDYRDLKKPIASKFRETKTPKGIAANNDRTANVVINLNLDSSVARFQTTITLKGQYSTLCRGIYLYNYKFPTINQGYNHKIWNLNDRVKLADSSCKVMTKEAPYTTIVKANYTCKDVVKQTDTGYQVSLKNWFPYISEFAGPSGERYLDYYPDFKGKEAYNYEIIFDRNIKLTSSHGEIYKWNTLGKMIFEAKQTGPRTILLKSYCLISAEQVTADKINDVNVIYEQIRSLQNSTLLVKLAEE